MNDQFDELTKSTVRALTRRAALKKFGVGLAGMALACFGLANKAQAAPQWCDPSVNYCCCRGCKTYLPHDHPNYVYCKDICRNAIGCGPGKPQFP